MTNEWTLGTLRRHLLEMRKLDQHALSLQASEYERRLSDLNHAHQEAQRVLNTYLPRETWEAWLKEEQQRRAKNDEEIASLRNSVSNIQAETKAGYAANARNLALATLILGVIVLVANHSLL